MGINLSLLADKGVSKFDLGEANELLNVSDLDELAQIVITKHWTPGVFNKINYIDNYQRARFGRRRTIDNCISADVLAFDVDAGCSLEKAKQLFSNYKHIIVTSRNHQKEKVTKGGQVRPAEDRFRLILFPQERIPNDQVFKATWSALYEKFPFFDESCKDVSRFYYAGEEIVSINYDGELVPLIEGEEPAKSAESLDIAPLGTVKGRLSRATRDFLLNFAPLGTRHNTMVKALFDLKEQGYSQEEARDRCMQAFRINGVDWGAQDDERVLDVYTRRQIKHPARWPKAKENKAGEWRPDPKEPANYEYLFGKMGYSFRKNDMSGDILVNEGSNPVNDDILDLICSQAMAEGLLYSRDVIWREVNRVAQASSFHPIKDQIEGALSPDDQHDYIGDLINTLKFEFEEGADEGEDEQRARYELYLEKWLVGCMAKLYRPGSQNLTLVFYGAQGIGKSRWLSRLALWERGYGEGHIDPANKDHVLRHLDNFIWHVPELETVTGKREAGALKDYLTKDFVSVRPAYARTARTGRSICSFCASVNVETFLNDWTGNRRFLTIPLSGITADHDVDIAKVFAQAKGLLDRGYKYWLNLEEIQELNEQGDRFINEGPIHHIVRGVHPGNDPMTAHDIFDFFEHNRASYNDFSILGILLKKRGVERRRLRVDGTRSRFYMVDKTRLGQRT